MLMRFELLTPLPLFRVGIPPSAFQEDELAAAHGNSTAVPVGGSGGGDAGADVIV